LLSLAAENSDERDESILDGSIPHPARNIAPSVAAVDASDAE